jgi:hypothetical protein
MTEADHYCWALLLRMKYGITNPMAPDEDED